MRPFCAAVAMLFLSLLGSATALDSAHSAFEKGNTLFKEGKFAEAEQAYELALIDADTASVRFNIARVRESLGDSAGAMLEWERALRIDPGHKESIKALEEARRATGAITPPRLSQGSNPSTAASFSALRLPLASIAPASYRIILLLWNPRNHKRNP